MDQCGGRDAGVMRPEVVAVRCPADRRGGCGPVGWGWGWSGRWGWSRCRCRRWSRCRCRRWGWSRCRCRCRSRSRLGGAGLLHESVQGW